MTPPLKTTAEQRAKIDYQTAWLFSYRLVADIETLLAANKALEDENATYKAGCHNAILAWEIITEERDQLEQALKRAGKVTNERVEAALDGWFGSDDWRQSPSRVELERMRAALTTALAIQPKGDGEPAGQDGWQPIATAPKDGTRFHGLVRDDLIAMFWHPKFSNFVSAYRRMKMAPGYTIDGESYSDHSPTIHHPTHWRPLPAPPDTGDR